MILVLMQCWITGSGRNIKHLLCQNDSCVVYTSTHVLNSKWFIIVTCAYIYIIIYNHIYKHTKSTRPYGPISHQINKYINWFRYAHKSYNNDNDKIYTCRMLILKINVTQHGIGCFIFKNVPYTT